MSNEFPVQKIVLAAICTLKEKWKITWPKASSILSGDDREGVSGGAAQ